MESVNNRGDQASDACKQGTHWSLSIDHHAHHGKSCLLKIAAHDRAGGIEWREVLEISVIFWY